MPASIFLSFLSSQPSSPSDLSCFLSQEEMALESDTFPARGLHLQDDFSNGHGSGSGNGFLEETLGMTESVSETWAEGHLEGNGNGDLSTFSSQTIEYNGHSNRTSSSQGICFSFFLTFAMFFCPLLIPSFSSSQITISPMQLIMTASLRHPHSKLSSNSRRYGSRLISRKRQSGKALVFFSPNQKPKRSHPRTLGPRPPHPTFPSLSPLPGLFSFPQRTPPKSAGTCRCT